MQAGWSPTAPGHASHSVTAGHTACHCSQDHLARESLGSLTACSLSWLRNHVVGSDCAGRRDVPADMGERPADTRLSAPAAGELFRCSAVLPRDLPGQFLFECFIPQSGLEAATGRKRQGPSPASGE